MIRINRGGVPQAIKVYTKKNVKALDGVARVTKAEQEIEKAKAFFTNPGNYSNEQKITKDTFAFTVYKDPELVTALESIFGKKCAYCESRFAHVTPKDIEHFRPKSEINNGAGILRPGYFWLASEWENLFVSCPDCNRSRNHEVPGQAAKVKLGKETQFPLSDEGRRLRSNGPLGMEESVRLLLNPCVDNPANHLTFGEDGLIHARTDANGIPSRMGIVSITVYALQRKALVEERLEVLNALRFHFQELSFLVGNHNNLKALGADSATLDANADQIRAVKNQLRSMLTSTSPYLAMLHEWIRLAQQRGEFERLLQFKIDPTTLI